MALNPSFAGERARASAHGPRRARRDAGRRPVACHDGAAARPARIDGGLLAGAVRAAGRQRRASHGAWRADTRAARAAGRSRDVDCRDRGGGGPEQGDGPALAAPPRAQDVEPVRLAPKGGVPGGARRGPARVDDGLRPPRRDRVRDRRARLLPLSPVPRRERVPATSQGEGDSRGGGRWRVQRLRIRRLAESPSLPSSGSRREALRDHAKGVVLALDTLRAEARKCVLLCSNCHAEVEERGIRAPTQAC